MSKKKTQKILKLLPQKSRMEIISNGIFKTFLKQEKKINKKFDNEHITIIPYCISDFCGESETLEEDDIVCYEVYPKSNSNVVIYVDDKELTVTLNKKVVDLSEDELAFLAANMVGYINKYYA